MGSASPSGWRARRSPLTAGTRRFARAVLRRMATQSWMSKSRRALGQRSSLGRSRPLPRALMKHPASDASFIAGADLVPRRRLFASAEVSTAGSVDRGQRPTDLGHGRHPVPTRSRETALRDPVGRTPTTPSRHRAMTVSPLTFVRRMVGEMRRSPSVSRIERSTVPAGPTVRGWRGNKHERRTRPTSKLQRPSDVPPKIASSTSVRAGRFRRSVEARPLERAQPLPRWARPLARTIMRRDRIPAMTIGPNTRRALHAAGAPAAASGATLHFSRHPDPTPHGLGMIAHELSHASAPLPTPALFLDDMIDSGERRARSVGEQVRARAEALGSRGHGLVPRGVSPFAPAIPVSALPVGGLPTAIPAAGRAIDEAAERALGMVAGGPVTGGGSGAVGDLARLAAHVTSLPFPAGPHLAEATEIVGRAGDIASSAGMPASGGSGSTPTRSVAGSASVATDPHSQMGDLLEALEERVIVELERRGGRFAGVF